jgi:hypothetical protein
MTQTRTVLKSPAEGGRTCPSLTQNVSCSVDCGVSDWINGSCNMSDYTMLQTRSILTSPVGDGQSCPSLSQTVSCDLDCQVSDWYDINNTCYEDGLTTQQRDVVLQPSGKGQVCPSLTQTVSCSLQNYINPYIVGYFNFENNVISQTKMI